MMFNYTRVILHRKFVIRSCFSLIFNRLLTYSTILFWRWQW
ncbi:hypothetical protein HanRHA438_Chr04g0186681 [Helianthus annuus]|nr:hypothetical protein HanRHA438_Chr04g0186681 [Helianthus annuus]